MEVLIQNGVARYPVTVSTVTRLGGVPIPASVVCDPKVHLVVAECAVRNTEYVIERQRAAAVGYRSAVAPLMWVVPRRYWSTREMRGRVQSELFEE